MSLQGVETVTIRRKTNGALDDYGLPAQTITTIDVPGVLVGFGSTNEPALAGEDPQAAGVTLYFPAGTVIEQADEFIVRGEVWVKDGRQADWVSPFLGLTPGVVVSVRQYLG